MANISEIKLGTLGNGNRQLGIGFNFLGGKIYTGMDLLEFLNIILNYNRSNINNALKVECNSSIINILCRDKKICEIERVNRFIGSFTMYNQLIDNYTQQILVPYSVIRKKIVMDTNIDGYTTSLGFKEDTHSVIIGFSKSKSANLVCTVKPAILNIKTVKEFADREDLILKLIRENSTEYKAELEEQLIRRPDKPKKMDLTQGIVLSDTLSNMIKESDQFKELQKDSDDRFELKKLNEKLDRAIKQSREFIKDGYIYKHTKSGGAFEWRLDTRKDESECKTVPKYERHTKDCFGTPVTREVSRPGNFAGYTKEYCEDSRFKEAEKRFKRIDKLQKKIQELEKQIMDRRKRMKELNSSGKTTILSNNLQGN